MGPSTYGVEPEIRSGIPDAPLKVLTVTIERGRFAPRGVITLLNTSGKTVVAWRSVWVFHDASGQSLVHSPNSWGHQSWRLFEKARRIAPGQTVSVLSPPLGDFPDARRAEVCIYRVSFDDGATWERQ